VCGHAESVGAVLSENPDIRPNRERRDFGNWDEVRWGPALERLSEKGLSAVRESHPVREFIDGLLKSEGFWRYLENIRAKRLKPEAVAKMYVPHGPEAREAVAYIFNVAADVSPKHGEDPRHYRRRVEGWLGNVGAVAYFPGDELEAGDARRVSKRGSIKLDQARGEPVELFIRHGEQRCLCCGERTRARHERNEESGRLRLVDHCRECEANGEAAAWGRSQRAAINELLMKVTPLVLQDRVLNRARRRRGQRSSHPRPKKPFEPPPSWQVRPEDVELEPGHEFLLSPIAEAADPWSAEERERALRESRPDALPHPLPPERTRAPDSDGGAKKNPA
jgi:hypothetical protein